MPNKARFLLDCPIGQKLESYNCKNYGVVTSVFRWPLDLIVMFCGGLGRQRLAISASCCVLIRSVYWTLPFAAGSQPLRRISFDPTYIVTRI